MLQMVTRLAKGFTDVGLMGLQKSNLVVATRLVPNIPVGPGCNMGLLLNC